jgi:hypothetical protein
MEHLKISADTVKQLLSKHTIHHVEDGKTLQFVPSDIHDAFKHTGGRAAIKDMARSAGDIIAPSTAALIASGHVTASGAAKAVLTDFGEAVDPGIGMIATKENAEKAGRGFWNEVDGSGNYGDFSHSHKYDMWESFKGTV